MAAIVPADHKQQNALSILQERAKEQTSLTSLPPRWSCQDCGCRVRSWHRPPEDWHSVRMETGGTFLGYRCGACVKRIAERKAKYKAKAKNMAAIRQLREKQLAELRRELRQRKEMARRNGSS